MVTKMTLLNDLFYTMPFGKYKGRCIKDIPNNYIAWLLRCDIVKGELRTKIENCIKAKYKDAWLNKALKEWIYNNYSPRSYSTSCPNVDFIFASDLYDAMDGCLPNQ